MLRAGDRVLADLRIGWEDRARERPWRPETQALGFSATKGLASMVIHRLADRGLIDYDAQVAAYWPEFAAAGKGRITVRELLSHRAGLYDVQAVARNADELLDHIGMERRLAAATPEGPPGRPAYHAITFGWLASGLARAVTGEGDARARPDRARRASRHLRPRDRHGRWADEPAEMVGRSLRIYTAFGMAATPSPRLAAGHPSRLSRPARPGLRTALPGPDPAVWRTEMPAVNGALSADGLSRLYVPLATGGLAPGGGHFLSAETVERLGASRHAASTGSSASACAGASASTTRSGSAAAPPAAGPLRVRRQRRLGRPRHRLSFGFVEQPHRQLHDRLGDMASSA